MTHDVEDIYELSPLQQGMLFHSLEAPETGVYLIRIVTTLEGALDIERFETAWQQVVARQPVLRTSFHWGTISKPVQVVHRSVPLTIAGQDWREHSDAERAAALKNYLAADAASPMPLDRTPLTRLAVMRTAAQRWTMVWSFPHILLEGWSASLVMADVFAVYHGLAANRLPAPSAAPRYRDYIGWLQQQDAPAAEAHWRAALAGFAAPTPLSVDRLAAGDGPETYARRKMRLPAETTAALQALGREQRLTLSTIFQGAWALLLAKYSGESDVVFGSVVSGREVDFAGVESLVGLCVNTLPLRARMKEEEPVAAWLRGVQSAHALTRQFEYCSLVDIQRWSEVPRGTRLFESIFVFENWGAGIGAADAEGDLRVLTAESFEGGSGYPLVVEVAPGRETSIGFAYDTRRLTPAAIDGMLGHYAALLAEISRRPLARVRELSILPAAEREQILRTWNDTSAPHDSGATVHDLFVRQAALTPEAVAVSSGPRVMTYGELDARSAALAAHLRGLGVRPGVLVAVLTGRSVDMVVALLGVLRAGGAYVPLDPAFPASRLAYMLADAGCTLAIVDAGNAAELPGEINSVVRADEPGTWGAAAPAAARVDARADDLAYVIYTSGSTGAPKGVQIPHGAVVNFLESMQREFGLTAHDRLVAVTTLSFDIAGLELFLPLSAGASVVIADRDTALDGVRLAGLLDAAQATVMQATPATWRQLIDSGWRGRPLMKLLCGGESLPRDLADALLARGAGVWNLYGPTETTIWSTVERVATGPEAVSIGRPIANTRVYIVDGHGHPVPVGIRGELFIGGDGLARGYLNRPELTAERFVPDPFSADPAARMYRTGDHARYLPDGRIEWLGRADHQVKVRGFRIELGEIEAALRDHPALEDAVVIVREDTPGDRRIVAYLRAAAADGVPAAELRAHLQQRLPDYMLPSVFVTVSAWPRTPNGKIDRSALPAPDGSRPGTEDGFVAPRTPVEDLLAGIWSEVLGVARVGVHDNFFELGGHSLVATRILSRVRTVLGRDLPLRRVFQTPTIAGLAEALEAADHGRPVLPPIEAADRTQPMPLSFAQERLWFVHQLDPQSAAYNLAGAVRLQGTLDVASLEGALTEIVRRHETLRTAIVIEDGMPVPVVEPAVPFRLQVIDRESGASEVSLDEFLSAEARRPFDLTRAPLLRAALVRIDATVHVLAVTMHHLASDAWSIGIFVRELGALYAAFTRGETAPLGDLPVQYADFALWQRQWLQGERLESELGYWTSALQGAPLVLQLPSDRPRPAVQTARGARHTQMLGLQASDALRDLGRREGATLYMTLLAAFQVVLQRYTGLDDFLVGSPIAGRTQTEIEPLIGFFANTVVMRADLAGDPTVAALLARVRERALDAYGHQDLPFEQLVTALHPERDPSRNPVVQVMFALQNTPGEPLELPGVTWLPQETSHATSPFDVTLFVQESEQGLVTTVQYSTDLFEAATIARLHQHLHRVLELFAGASRRRLSELEMLSASERDEMLVTWNETTATLAGTSCVHELFELAVDRHPGALAVSCGTEQLTYAALDQRANQVAHALQAEGVGPEAVVAVCLSRSPSLLVAILGILKAGGAYLPLDPGYPADRLQFMVRDARVSSILTETAFAGTFEGNGAPALCLDTPGSAIDRSSRERPRGGVGREHLAYVIYTSGSTGQPKGVQIEHAGLLNLARWHQRVHGVSRADRATQLAGLGFDASVWELWPYLISGASIHMPDDESRLSPAALIAWLASERISIAFLPTPLLEATLNERWPAHRLRRVLTGGDRLHRGAAADLRFELFNHYGPTENSVVTTWGPAADGDGPPPIGRPIDNTGVYLLDEQLRPVPIGAAGELHISGVGLSRGYRLRPDLTAERFIPHPFSTIPGARLYKTGDFARYQSDGTLIFVGRMDGQVKLRGFRVELAEIEVALGRHPQVREAAVVVNTSGGSSRLLAYFTPAGDRPPAAGELRAHLAETLPDYMVPATFLPLDALPLTANGKIDRAALAAAEGVPAGESAPFSAPETAFEQAIAGVWRSVLQVDSIGADDNFFDRGGHSLLLMQVHRQLQQRFGGDLRILDLFRYPTVRALAAHIADAGRANITAPARLGRPARRRTGESDAVAIIGMAGRFPGAADLAAFWSNLAGGVESVTFFSDDELARAGVDAARLADPRYVRARAVVDGIEQFDAGFFGYSPREAELIDPQQRLFLECAWHALEDAGCDPSRTDARIGVFGGVGMNTYVMHILANPAVFEDAGVFQVAVASDKDFLTTRVAYKLNLRGPSVTVQTGCSTSLVAVHLACRSLLDGECDMAMAGGVRLALPQQAGYLYEPGGIVSPDGHCRAFDAKAQGTVSGSGVGIVVLKRLDEALADRDRIVAVIRGSAINNDGAEKVGYTAPSVSGQGAVVRAALDAAGVRASAISYIEVHGTGTALGDPIEIAALADAFAGSGSAAGSCAIGSVKTNIGHLDAAAGVAGLIKTALALQHATLPASLHFESPHPEIDFGATPFVVNSRSIDWAASTEPRRAGVSSFGIGGTNAHVILEQAPPVVPSGPSREWQVLPISARSARALDVATVNLATHLQAHGKVPLPDVAFALQTGRRRFEHRRALVAGSTTGALESLGGVRTTDLWTGGGAGDTRRVAFLFPGQGAQFDGMCRGLFETEPVFRDEVGRCAALLAPALGFDLRTLLYPSDDDVVPPATLGDTAITQPALFVVEYALARLWKSCGVEPSAMIGHSIGEYVAACLAGVFSLEDALGLVAARGRLMQAMAPGAMLAVSAGPERLDGLLPDEVVIAALNAPELTVVSGSVAGIDALSGRLAGAGIECQRIHTSHAFHSPMMDALLPEFEAQVRRTRRRAPQIPFVSNVTGTWITTEQATDPAYWATHLRRPVRFVEGVAVLREDAGRVLLEVGPGTTLSTLVRRQPATGAALDVVNSGRHPRQSQADEAAFASAMARLWVAGVEIDWAGRAADEARNRVPLPGYPFERQRYWIEAPKPGTRAAVVSTGKSARIDDWFYVPSWRVQPAAGRADAVAPQHWLLLTDGKSGVGSEVARRLERSGHTVSVAARSGRFGRRTEGSYEVEPTESGFHELLAALDRDGRPVPAIAHLWSLDQPVAQEDHAPLHELMALLRELGRGSSPAEVVLLGSGLHGLPGGPAPNPAEAMLLGPCRVAPQEYAHVTCRTIDVPRPDAAWLRARVAGQIAGELLSRSHDLNIAFRGVERLVQVYEPVRTVAGDRESPTIREGGVYVITGGLGEVGLTLAEFLAREHRARLVLVGRSSLPPRAEWPDIDATGAVEDARGRRIGRIRALEASGSEVLVVSADVADPAAMARVFDQAETSFGHLHGVIHAAGVTTRSTMRPIAALTTTDCEEQLRPKVAGVVALEQALAGRTLDFCLLASSLSTVLGGPGLAAYAAGNLFLNAFARRMNGCGPTPWISLVWDGWSFPTESRRPGRFDMEAAEGVETFRRALAAAPVSELIVSTGDLRARLDQWVDKPAQGAEGGAAERQHHARPELASAYDAPVGETEIALVEIWRTLLGIDSIGTADNFFELGGHSLLALRLTARLQEAFQIELPVQVVFDAPTVKQMAALVERTSAALDAEVARMEEMLRMVEDLPDDQLRGLLEPQE